MSKPSRHTTMITNATDPPSSLPSTPPRNAQAAQPQSAPTAPKLGASKIYTTLHFERLPEMRQLGAEMEGQFIGPMPVDEFLDEFLPLAGTRLPWKPSSAAAFNLMAQQETEDNMYPHFIDALNPFCDTLDLVDTHNVPDMHCDRLKPDVCAYEKGSERRGITDFSGIEMHVEFKISASEDPFVDWNPGDKHTFERDTAVGKDTKGQITSYVAAHFASQFRNFAYSVIVFGAKGKTWARLLRWDQSGAIVTRAFPLHSTTSDEQDGPKKLAEFFWRYNRLSRQQRGLDPTVSRASGPAVDAARKVLNLDKDDLVMEIVAVDGDGDGRELKYLVGHPAVSVGSAPTGRSTKGFVAYEPTSKSVVYLKNTWRLDVDGTHKEGAVYKVLESHYIPHVAHCELSGDVLDHATRTQQFVSKPWACTTRKPKQLLRHRHYRLVLNVVGSPLYRFHSTRELVIAVGDAFEAHKLAYEKARILHRDISVGNILIDAHGRGLLIDWDFSKPRDDINEQPRREQRTGTWQFMSARLLLAKPNEIIQHTLQDDMESFVHVLGWVALRFIPNSLTPSELLGIIRDIFDYLLVVEDNRAQGGGHKVSALFENKIPFLVAPRIPKFRELLQELTEACSVRYMREPSPAEVEEFQQGLHKAQSSSDDYLLNLLLKLPASVYLRRLEYIRDSGWMLQKFRAAVASSEAEHWPEADEASENKLEDFVGNPTAAQRKATADLVSLRLP